MWKGEAGMMVGDPGEKEVCLGPAVKSSEGTRASPPFRSLRNGALFRGAKHFVKKSGDVAQKLVYHAS